MRKLSTFDKIINNEWCMASIDYKRTIFILWILYPILCLVNSHQTFILYWNRTSFKAYQHDSLTFHVNLGDVMDLICPYYNEQDSYMKSDFEQYDIYRVTETEYDMCNINQLNLNPITRLVMSCNNPYDLMKYTLSFRSYLPIPNGLEFHSNQTYFFLSKNQQCSKLKIVVHDFNRISSSLTTTSYLNEHKRKTLIFHNRHNYPIFSHGIKAQRFSDSYSIKWVTEGPKHVRDSDKFSQTTNSISTSNIFSLALTSSSTSTFSSFDTILLLFLLITFKYL